MKCKVCGGNLLFENNKGVCESCGAIFAIDSIYENVDVYICYEENDASGRRTKDSIIAQELYLQLESARISAFYERISADGVIGDELETLRYATMRRAKAVLILGASIESFHTIAEKYGTYLEGKTVIPFCVDVNPSAIPKTLSKIQAVNYNTIGWEKDLINGLYNLLGREKEINSNSIYVGARKKRGIVIGIITGLLLIALVLAAFWLVKKFDEQNSAEEQKETEKTEKPLSQQEIYDEAMGLIEQGDFCGALKLFDQIPEHPNSANMINQIYSKYEGYYQNGTVVIHLEIFDNNRADMKIKITSGSQVLSAEVSAEITVDKVVGDYLDSGNNAGKFELILVNDGLKLKLGTNLETSDIDVFFKLSEKSDQPIVHINSEMLFDWLKKEYTFNQICELGYELDVFEDMATEEFSSGGENLLYKIEGTTIYLSMISAYSGGDGILRKDSAVLVGIAAPAELIAPTMIGKESFPVLKNNILYWPNAYLRHMLDAWFEEDFFADSEDCISKNTIIGMTMKSSKYIQEWNWESLVVSMLDYKVRVAVKKTYNVSLNDVSGSQYSENNTHYLMKVHITSKNKFLWYRMDKQSQSVTFITEGTSDYPPDKLAQEFPDAFD